MIPEKKEPTVVGSVTKPEEKGEGEEDESGEKEQKEGDDDEVKMEEEKGEEEETTNDDFFEGIDSADPESQLEVVLTHRLIIVTINH